jgi:hypothetical protein
MNAYELADIVDKWAYKESAEYLTDAATLIRQQADRIRNLEKTLGFKNSGYETINLTPPVAWMQHHDETGKVTKYSPVQTWEDDIPLYTHPVKTLTDEEILREAYYILMREQQRKAQEK